MRIGGLAQRRGLLIAALAALRVATREPELELLHRWLDTWTGIGLIATGMARQDYDLQLSRHDTPTADGARRSTSRVGSTRLTDDTGSARESTPWRAVQVATWEVVGKG